MTNRSPTLAEMQHSLAQSEVPIELITMESEDIESVLKHYGIKGQRWGIRRSDSQLGKSRIKNEEGEDVGGIRAKSKAAAEKLRNMRTGEVMVLDTADSGPKVLVKQKDGSFKEATISSDAQSVLRTINKDPAEMSTREISEANKRAQAIEQYNKIFNPSLDPNAQLRARVEAMELQSKYSSAYAKMNPTKAQKVGSFVSSLSPVFDTYQKLDKSLDGDITKNLKKEWNKLRGMVDTDQAQAPTGTDRSKASQKADKKKRKKQKTTQTNVIYDITSFGNDDPMNPFVPVVRS